MKKLFTNLLLMLVLGVGSAWAEIPTYTWDFTNTTTWTTAKISTGSAVTLNPSGKTPATGEYGVTFNFESSVTIKTDVTGAAGQVVKQSASSSVGGTYLWYYANGTATSNNVSITVPSKFKVAFSLVYGSSTRPFVYSTDGGTTTNNLSSGNLEYENTTDADVTVTLWASNCNRNGAAQNAISSIVLKDLSSVATHTATINAVATIDNVKTTIKTNTVTDIEENQEYTVSSCKVISYGGKYYEQENSSTMTDFSKTYTMGTADETREINYVLAEDIEYYAEGENLGAGGQDVASTISSGGQYTSYYSNLKETSALTGGSYQLEYITRGRAANAPTSVYASDGTTALYTVVKGGYSDNVLNISNLFYVTANSTVKVGQNGNSASYDYILVRRISDYEGVGATNCSTNYFSAWNKTAVQINDGETGYYKIKNHNSGTGATYQNWYLFVANTSNINKTVLRADNDANKLEVSPATDPVTYYQIGTFGNSDNYNSTNVNFATDLSDATVELYVTYNKPTLSVTAKTTTSAGVALPDYTYTQTDYTDDALNLYVSVEKSWLEVLAQGKDVTKTLGTTGFGTFSAAVPVTVPEGVTVYTSTYASNTVTATPDASVTVIPANTGVIFKGEASKSYTFTATSEAGSAITTALTAAPNGVTGDGSTIYGLLKAEKTFALVKSDVTLANNSAYLKVSSGAKAINVVFDDETTGISNVNTTVANNAARYNLAGQRVSANTKGIVIMNGKKYLNK